MKTLLVPVDLSDVSAAVVAAAVPLARAFQARVVLLYAVRPVRVINEYSAYIDELNLQRDPKAEQILADFRSDLAREGIESESEQVFGPPIECILEKAEEIRADYIVMGSHGHGAIYDLLLGSTTTGVLRNARPPVLIVGTKRSGTPSVASVAQATAG